MESQVLQRDESSSSEFFCHNSCGTFYNPKGSGDAYRRIKRNFLPTWVTQISNHKSADAKNPH